jgi:hypothetical protein
MLGLYEERYRGFTVTHFHEQPQKRHDYKLSYTVTRLALEGAGLLRPAAQALSASQEAAAPAAGRNDAASRCIALRLAAGRCSAIRFCWSRSTTRPAQSVRAFPSRRRAQRRAFARWPR